MKDEEEVKEEVKEEAQAEAVDEEMKETFDIMMTYQGVFRNDILTN